MIIFRTLIFALLLVAGSIADETTIRATLLPADQRKPAPEFKLMDPSGAKAAIADYRGKVVLLDFWATWCGGCKHEIPWFEEFSKTYSSKGLAVIGVSLDEDGWKVLRPFLAQHPISYRVVLGNQATAQQYGIEGMPDTFLIDQHGRVAAAYKAGIVNRENMNANIRDMLAER